MKAIAKVGIGAVVLLGTMALYAKGVGDEANVDDVVLVPARKIDASKAPPAMQTVLKALADRKDVSVIVRVIRIDGDAIDGEAFGAATDKGQAEVGTQAAEKFPVRISRADVLGILERGRPIETPGGLKLAKGVLTESGAAA